MTYEIGQRFVNIFDKDVQDWCNANDCILVPVEKVEQSKQDKAFNPGYGLINGKYIRLDDKIEVAEKEATQFFTKIDTIITYEIQSKPVIDELSQIETDRIAELQNYLSDTDWYIIRELEKTLTTLPPEIVQARSAARDEINAIQLLVDSKTINKELDISKEIDAGRNV